MSRVTDSMVYNRSQESLDKARNNMLKNQEEASTLKRVNRPSDDPMGTTRALSLRAGKDRAERISANLDTAGNLLNLTDSSLGDLTEVIARAKEIALQMSSTSNQAVEARDAVSKEVEQLALRVIQIGNTKLGERYIFGGYSTGKPPFDEKGNYYGDAGEIKFEYGGEQQLTVNTPGSVPFFGIREVAQKTAEGKDLEPGAPKLDGELRSPASILARNRGIDPSDDPKQMAALQSQSGVNIFRVIRDFASHLQDGDIGKINQAVDFLDGAYKQVLASRTMVGAQQNLVKMGIQSEDDSVVSSSDLISKIEDADSVKVFSDLARNENLLKVSLETNKKMLTPSLLDFLK